MQKITVTIHWSDPDDLCQITADHIKMALSKYCTNTTFEVEASRDTAVPSALDLETIDQIEMAISFEEIRIQNALYQQHIRTLYDWYKKARGIAG